MDKDINIRPIGQGIIRSFVLTLILLLIYAIITSFVDTNSKFDVVYKVIITALGVMYGAIYATKKINKRGWLVGLVVALLYIVILYFVSVLNGRELALNNFSILRMILALLVGMLSGMLGVNL